MKGNMENRLEKVSFTCSGKMAFFLLKVRSQNQFWTFILSIFQKGKHFMEKSMPPLHN
jgi:hypothetical protein